MRQRRTARTRRVQRERRQRRVIESALRDMGLSAERAFAMFAEGLTQAAVVLGEFLLGFAEAFVDALASWLGDTFLEAWNRLTPEEQEAVLAEAHAGGWTPT